jgi:hypothetical protein
MPRVEKDIDMTFVKKCEHYGNAIREVRLERERQLANAPYLPSAYSDIQTSHMLQRDDEAINAKCRANAVLRLKPSSRRKPPTTEIEKLVAMAPKTSSQVVGFHGVPDFLTEPPKPPPPTDELSKMRSYYPRSEGHAPGFHHDFSAQMAREAKEADGMLSTLTAAQLKADPQLAKALKTIKQRAVSIGGRYDNSGVPKGIATKARPW